VELGSGLEAVEERNIPVSVRSSGFQRRVDLHVETKVSDTYTVSRVEELTMETVCFSETLVSTNTSTRRYNPETNIDIFTAVTTSNLKNPCFCRESGVQAVVSH
jgi:hypothetical protein